MGTAIFKGIQDGKTAWNRAMIVEVSEGTADGDGNKRKVRNARVKDESKMWRRRCMKERVGWEGRRRRRKVRRVEGRGEKQTNKKKNKKKKKKRKKNMIEEEREGQEGERAKEKKKKRKNMRGKTTLKSLAFFFLQN